MRPRARDLARSPPESGQKRARAASASASAPRSARVATPPSAFLDAAARGAVARAAESRATQRRWQSAASARAAAPSTSPPTDAKPTPARASPDASAAAPDAAATSRGVSGSDPRARRRPRPRASAGVAARASRQRAAARCSVIAAASAPPTAAQSPSICARRSSRVAAASAASAPVCADGARARAAAARSATIEVSRSQPCRARRARRPPLAAAARERGAERARGVAVARRREQREELVVELERRRRRAVDAHSRAARASGRERGRGRGGRERVGGEPRARPPARVGLAARREEQPLARGEHRARGRAQAARARRARHELALGRRERARQALDFDRADVEQARRAGRRARRERAAEQLVDRAVVDVAPRELELVERGLEQPERRERPTRGAGGGAPAAEQPSGARPRAVAESARERGSNAPTLGDGRARLAEERARRRPVARERGRAHAERERGRRNVGSTLSPSRNWPTRARASAAPSASTSTRGGRDRARHAGEAARRARAARVLDDVGDVARRRSTRLSSAPISSDTRSSPSSAGVARIAERRDELEPVRADMRELRVAGAVADVLRGTCSRFRQLTMVITQGDTAAVDDTVAAIMPAIQARDGRVLLCSALPRASAGDGEPVGDIVVGEGSTAGSSHS